MYCLNAENFTLVFTPEVNEEDISYPVNTSLHVSVSSGGFSATDAVMEIDVKDLAGFACALNEMYQTLTGSAELREPYGEQCYLKLTADSSGHIHVSGKICRCDAGVDKHLLFFENQFDQTFLKDFAAKLYADFGSYINYSEE